MGDPLVTGPVLVLGASGQLGREFRDAVDRGMASSLSSTWVWADRQACDLARPEQVRAHAAGLKPGLIINAAAYTAVDRAESEPDLAQRINADSVHELAQYARDRKSTRLNSSHT